MARTYSLGTTVPPPEGKSFIHLLDGGISDNLGVAEPFRLLSTNDVSPNFFNQILKGRIRRVVFILVNARSARASKLNAEIATPGVVAMVGGAIGAAIDSATFANLLLVGKDLRERFIAAAARLPESLARNARKFRFFFVPVEFDAIEDDACRRDFQSIATSWTLPNKQIDALLIAGQALLKSAPMLKKVVTVLGASGLDKLPEIQDACKLMKAARR